MKRERYLLTYAVLCGMLHAGLPAQQKEAKINKIYHHRGAQHTPSLELGKLVLYFDSKPVVTVLPEKHASLGWKQLVYFFPQARLTREAKSKIAQLASEKELPYHVDMVSAATPVKGTKLFIQYDPRRVTLTPYEHAVSQRAYRSFDSIGLQRGVEFTFYNKKVRDALRKRINEPLLQVASVKKKRGVVIDCGHGGADYGAIGCKGIREKDIALDVGRQVAHFLQEHDISVALTRSSDTACALDERTSYANTVLPADAFVSIHANAARNVQASGIETYCLGVPEMIDDAKKKSEADHCVAAALRQRYDASQQLAQSLQSHLIDSAQAVNAAVKDRAVRHRNLQVLLGTAMPAALVELGFVSHVSDAKLLGRRDYRVQLARGISDGIMAYLQSYA